MQQLFIEADAVHEVWDTTLIRLLAYGNRVGPRGKMTVEFTGATLHVNFGNNCILANRGRDLNYRFMVAEMLWIMFGRSDVGVLTQYNRNMVRFSDDGIKLYGAYGPRIRDQYSRVVNALIKDKETRQAVITIFNPDMSTTTKDTPCTISMQFLLRKGLLNCIVTMRSSDIWLGFPYDFFTFSMVTQKIARQLNVGIGYLQMQLGSIHLYEEHWDVAQKTTGWSSFSMSTGPNWEGPDAALELVLDDPLKDPVVLPESITFKQVLQQPTRLKAFNILRNKYGSPPYEG